MTRTLVLTAHPALEHSRVNRALLEAALTLPADERPALRDLYALYPDFLINVAAEREALASADLLVWQFPMQWYSQPPLLKLWQDEVLGLGWAYGPGGHALQGKSLWLVVSTGGTAETYQTHGPHGHPIEAFWPPFEQTARLTGMRFLPPLVMFGSPQCSQVQLAEHGERFVQGLRAPWAGSTAT